MDQLTMEKKNIQRTAALCNKSSFDLKSTEYYSKKNGSQCVRKREYEKFDKKSTPNRGGRQSQRYVRSREKMGGQVESSSDVSEVGSLQRSGSKKQNLTRIDIQNWYSPLDKHITRGYHKGRQKSGQLQHAKYTKEHYMQANCQFVVIAGNDYSNYEKTPDDLVDWNFIEEVRLHMTEPPACPICLYPPICAKITRCGHVYCFSCALHYLALSDKKWRKCPICDQIISLQDLKSVKPILHKNWKCGEEIELQLMRRDRDSLVPVAVANYCPSKMKRTISLIDSDSVSSFTKLIVASTDEVLKHIVSRELEDLRALLTIEGDEPEACFIEAALSLVSDRYSKISRSSTLPSDLEDIDEIKCEGAASLIDSNRISASVDTDPSDERIDDVLQIEKMTLSECGISERDSTGAEDDSFLNISNDELHSDQRKKYEPDDRNLSSQRGFAKEIGPKATFYFYQESGGSHIYLNPLNVKMLTKEYGHLEKCPLTLKAKVLEKESDSMTDALRQKMRCLNHLPISCPFEFVEIDLGLPVISLLTKCEFEGQLEQRERNRQRRAREERRIERRVRVEEDRSMGRMRRSYVHTTSFQHFPTFATEEPLVGNSEDETTTAASQSDVFSDDGHVSFAQMIREGQKQPSKSVLSTSPSKPVKKEINAWPSVGGRAADDSEDEAECVPDFSEAFSADFGKALDAASQKMSNSAGARTKLGKKKKKKRIVLLSSGGF